MIRWISQGIGTAAFDTMELPADAFLLDVRDLVDKGGNPATTVRAKIDEAVAERRAGRRVVVCCDYGMSRSSAIAAGVIAVEEGLPYDDALRRVMTKTGEKAVRVEVVSAVRAALGEPTNAHAATSSRSVVVTGGTGFLGREIALRLARTCEVATPTHEEVDLTCDAVAFDRVVRERAADTVVHLANPRIYTTSASLGEMLTLLKNVADVCAQHDVHLIFPSGWEVFSGYRTRHLLADEATPPRSGSSYGHAKLLCEHLLAQVHAQTGLRYSLLRIAPIYGGTSTRPKFISNFVAKALRNEPIVTHRYHNGEPSLDLLHVEDALAALLKAIERRPGTLIHVGTGIATSTTQVARAIVSLARSSSTISSQSIDGYAANIAMDPKRACAILEWEPARTLEDGLRHVVESHGSGS